MYKFLYFLCSLTLLTALIFFASTQIGYSWDWSGVWEYRVKFLLGWLMTLQLSVLSLVLSIILASVFLLLQNNSIKPISYLVEFWIQVIRGTPFLVQILIFYYIIGTALHIENRFVMSILILSNFSACYSAEILRASLESLPRDQRETAKSFGMHPCQTLYYILIPQVFRQSLPGMAGQLCSLVKDSSLLSIIAVSELTLNAQEVNAITYGTLEAYIPLAIAYLLLTWPITLLSKRLERRLDYGY